MKEERLKRARTLLDEIAGFFYDNIGWIENSGKRGDKDLFILSNEMKKIYNKLQDFFLDIPEKK